MSAICGVINFDGKPVSSETAVKMMNVLKKFPIDDDGAWIKRESFLGNIIKYITPECKLEKMPRVDDESGLVITADAIIDNREEILSMMNIQKEKWSSLADSEIILKAYLKWGEDCPKYLVGDFAFAIWDERKKELFCARDHIGKRTFYYYHSKNTFAFCTVIKPMLQLDGVPKELNEQWIGDYLAIESLVHEIECDKTIYKDIMQLLPNHTLKINCNGISTKRYWDASKVKKLRLKTNAEYEEAFREVFFKAVRSKMRSIGNVGVMLSGGLDSGSVAAVAAMNLKKVNKNLKTYSMVPMQGYVDWLPRYEVADETPFIELYKQHYDNIDSRYLNFQELNSFNNMDELIDILEQPYKTVQNLFWVNETVATAAKDGCSVVLDGQLGNYTVSFGSFTPYLVSLLEKGKFHTFSKEILAYSKLYHCTYNEALKNYLSIINPLYIRTIYRTLLGKRYESNDIESKLKIINPRFELDSKSGERIQKNKVLSNGNRISGIDKAKKYLKEPLLFSQAGMATTKLGLNHGVAKRDATGDRRVIEFCMSLPNNQFVNNGEERSLIRRSMKNILPEEIRKNYYVRGRQGADLSQRLKPHNEDIKRELEKMMNNPIISKYIDTSAINKTFEKISSDCNCTNTNHFTMQNILIGIVFGKFIKKASALERG